MNARHNMFFLIAAALAISGCQSGPQEIPMSAVNPVHFELENALADGRELVGAAEADGEAWEFVFFSTMYDPDTGAFEAQIIWPTLDAVHKVEGVLTDTTFEFMEVDFIQQGNAILDCVYIAPLEDAGGRLEGLWGECQGYEGTFFVTLP